MDVDVQDAEEETPSKTSAQLTDKEPRNLEGAEQEENEEEGKGEKQLEHEESHSTGKRSEEEQGKERRPATEGKRAAAKPRPGVYGACDTDDDEEGEGEEEEEEEQQEKRQKSGEGDGVDGGGGADALKEKEAAAAAKKKEVKVKREGMIGVSYMRGRKQTPFRCREGNVLSIGFRTEEGAGKAVDDYRRYKFKEKSFVNFPIDAAPDGSDFLSPGTKLGKKRVRQGVERGNHSDEDVKHIARGIYCQQQLKHWEKTGEVMPFEKTAVYTVLNLVALEEGDGGKEKKKRARVVKEDGGEGDEQSDEEGEDKKVARNEEEGGGGGGGG